MARGTRLTWAFAVLLAACGGSVPPEAPDPSPPAETACRPVTCSDLGASCGTAPDGCGGTLSCGACSDGQTCGSAAEPNQCVPAPLTLRWRWKGRSGDFDPVAAADSAGDVLLVTKFLPPGEAMTAHATQLGPTGQERWSAPLDVYADTRLSITATSGDDVRVGGGGKILAFGPDGTPAWMQWGTSVVDLAPMSDGRVVALLHRPGCSFERCGEGRIVEYDADGSVRWTVSTGSETDFRGVAVSPDGTVYATDEEANVEKISPDGAVLWVHPWPATFAPGSRPAAVLPDGSVAVASSERLQVYAPDVGPLRWEIPLAPGASFAVGPSGELFLAQTYPTEPNCFGLELAELGPDGAERARRKLGTFRCDPDAGNDGPPHLSATVSRSGDPIVAGTFNVPVDFGGGSLTPAGTDVFVIVLAP